jgi:hypothetical protein
MREGERYGGGMREGKKYGARESGSGGERQGVESKKKCGWRWGKRCQQIRGRLGIVGMRGLLSVTASSPYICCAHTLFTQ